jgi:AcrR family transcriptional regulator
VAAVFAQRMSKYPNQSKNPKSSADDFLERRSETRRGMSQERSVERRSKIAHAAIEILASHGVTGLTHRLVAAKANVSLAATTYYFDTKYDIVAEASGITLRGYLESFRQAAERIRGESADCSSLEQFSRRLVHNAVRRYRVRTLCWAEIMLDAHRHAETMALARQWFEEVGILWRDIAVATGVQQPARASRSAIDISIGMLFMAIALGLDEDQVDAVLARGQDPLKSWGGRSGEILPGEPLKRLTQKSAETRERILAATVELLISDGPGAVTYHNIAARAGLTATAPFYHFPTVASLLSAAEQRLFEQSKERYRLAAATDPSQQPVKLERLIDRTATIILREATEFASKNLAAYAIWLAAARNPNVRPMVWSAIADQHCAWQRMLSPNVSRQRPLNALAAQAGCVGKTIRLLATGSATEDLASLRSEFAYDLTALSKDCFWL